MRVTNSDFLWHDEINDVLSVNYSLFENITVLDCDIMIYE